MTANELLKGRSDVIGRRFDATLDERLRQVLAPEIVRAFGASSAVFLLGGSDGSAAILGSAPNMTAMAISAYREYYWAIDPWANAALEYGLSKVYVSQDIVSTQVLEATECHFDWSRAVDLHHAFGGAIETEPRELGVLGVHRTQSVGTYYEERRQRLELFFPHLRRSLQQSGRLARAGLVERCSTSDSRRCIKSSSTIRPASASFCFRQSFSTSGWDGILRGFATGQNALNTDDDVMLGKQCYTVKVEFVAFVDLAQEGPCAVRFQH